MNDQKTKSVSEILGGMTSEKEPGTGTDVEEAGEGDSEGKMLTDAIFDAIKADDRDAFHEGLEAYQTHCEMRDKMPESAKEEAPKKGGVAIVLGGH